MGVFTHFSDSQLRLALKEITDGYKTQRTLNPLDVQNPTSEKHYRIEYTAVSNSILDSLLDEINSRKLLVKR